MSLITPTRRGFIAGLASLLAAPAIVRAGNIMPVRPVPFDLTATEVLSRYPGGLTWADSDLDQRLANALFLTPLTGGRTLGDLSFLSPT